MNTNFQFTELWSDFALSSQSDPIPLVPEGSVALLGSQLSIALQ